MFLRFFYCFPIVICLSKHFFHFFASVYILKYKVKDVKLCILDRMVIDLALIEMLSNAFKGISLHLGIGLTQTEFSESYRLIMV